MMATYISTSANQACGSDNNLSSVQCQAIIWSNGDLLLIGPLVANVTEILTKYNNFLTRK